MNAKDHGSCARCSKPASIDAGGLRLCAEHGSLSAVFGDLGLTNVSQLDVADDMLPASVWRERAQVANRALDESRHTNRQLAHRIQELEAKLARAREVNHAAIAGRRQFFGPVLMVPRVPGRWDGEVWLQDAEKRDRGYSLLFANVAAVHEHHPELWVVSVSGDGVLLDAWGQR